jgi:glycerol-3-phosphate acyltransferase PlsY
VFLRFKGGKAVAAFVGAALYVAPAALLVTTVIFVATVGLSKYISLGSIMGALTFPIGYWVVSRPPAALLTAAVFAAALIIYRHKGNIERLRLGKENVFSLKGGTAR